MPVRTVTQRTKTTCRYLIFSLKNDRVIACESKLERDMALRLEFAPNVLAYEEQPVTFVIPDDPDFKTTPDFKVVLDTGELEYIEVKYEKHRQANLSRLRTVTRHLKGEGITYRVMTENDIRWPQVLIDNLLFLRWFRKVDDAEMQRFVRLMPESPVSFQELAGILGSNEAATKAIATQSIFHDFSQPIRKTSMLRPVEPADFDYLYPKA